MAIGQASFVAGDVMWNWYEMNGEEPFPSFADVLYLAGYPFIAAGLLLLIRRLSHHHSTARLASGAQASHQIGRRQWV